MIGFTEDEKKDCYEIVRFIRKALKKDKFKIEEEFFVDGYLVEGDHYIWHIKLKQCPDWKFGVWIDPDEDNEYLVSIFAQPVHYIDKFKPSASIILYDWRINKGNIGSEDEWDEKDVLKVFRYVREQPYLAWYRDAHYVDYNLEYVSPEEAKADFEKAEEYRLLCEKINKELDDLEVEWMKNKVESLGFKYRITSDDYCYPRHTLLIEDPNIEKTGCYDWLEDEEWEEFLQIGENLKKKYPDAYLYNTFNRGAIFKKRLNNEQD